MCAKPKKKHFPCDTLSFPTLPTINFIMQGLASTFLNIFQVIDDRMLFLLGSAMKKKRSEWFLKDSYESVILIQSVFIIHFLCKVKDIYLDKIVVLEECAYMYLDFMCCFYINRIKCFYQILSEMS